MKTLKNLLFALLLAPALVLAGNPAPVNINTADQATLTQLKKIGPAKAAAIVADRKLNGTYKTIKDLTRVKGIGPAILKANEGMITVKRKKATK